MPGPKMGPRPDDFDETLVRRSPTFVKWTKLLPGEGLSYACRRFVKGGEHDEERLMRRIMIARRNNLKDHATLKSARAAEAQKRGVVPGTAGGRRRKAATPPPATEGASAGGGGGGARPPSPSNPSGTRRRRVAGTAQPTDEEVLMEMDVPAVEATRSYRRWCALPPGAIFRYNQTYVRGQDDHDWLLRKNIWRRMRYRRENRVKVAQMMGKPVVGAPSFPGFAKGPTGGDAVAVGGAEASDPVANDPPAVARGQEDAIVSRAVAKAAAAAAAQVEAFEPGIDADAVAALGANDPIVSSALDAAARLAAAAVAEGVAERVADGATTTMGGEEDINLDDDVFKVVSV